MTRHAVHRTHRQRVVAAEKHRECARARKLIAAPANSPGPVLDFPIMVRVSGRHVGQVGRAVDGKIPVVGHLKAEGLKQRQKAGGSKRRGAHQGAALRCAHIDGGTQ